METALSFIDDNAVINYLKPYTINLTLARPDYKLIDNNALTY